MLIKRERKKGVSLMLSYVLLVAIVIAVSVGVYSWMRFYGEGFIKEIPKCEEGVSISIKNYECLGGNTIRLDLKNNGNFNISGISVKGTDNEDKVANRVLDSLDFSVGTYSGGRYSLRAPLAPQEEISIEFSYGEIELPGDLAKIEVGPYRIQKDSREEELIVFCDDSIVVQRVNGCSLTSA